jgi:hypothetical protein
MITPGSTTQPSPAAEVCAPADALAVDGVAPAVGDTVEFQARARVTRIEGDKVYLDTTDVNGMPTHRQGEGEEMPDAPDRDEMMRAAMAADAA